MDANRVLVVMLLAWTAAAGRAANAQPPIDLSTAPLAAAFRTIAGDLQAAAERMPADRYAFRPVAGVRSYGQVVAHVAGGHFLYCSRASGARLSSELASRLTEVRPFSDVETEPAARTFGKEELVALLNESIEFCEAAYSRGSGAADALIGNIAHSNEHYGNLVTYLRLSGFVPPSTERRTRESPRRQ